MRQRKRGDALRRPTKSTDPTFVTRSTYAIMAFFGTFMQLLDNIRCVGRSTSHRRFADEAFPFLTSRLLNSVNAVLYSRRELTLSAD
jgi:hypothetical protein